MKLYIDEANVASIQTIFKLGIFSGITTNPTILKNNGGSPLQTIKSLLEKFEGDVFVQCTSEDVSDIVKEGEALNSLDPKKVILKIPFCPNGIRAAKMLVDKGIRVTLTGIHTLSQAVVSSVVGVDYIAPYVNRMENGGISIETVLNMQKFLENEKSKTRIIAASFKNLQQLEKVMSYNVYAVTAPVALYKLLFENALTEKAIRNFNSDWQQIDKKEWVI